MGTLSRAVAAAILAAALAAGCTGSGPGEPSPEPPVSAEPGDIATGTVPAADGIEISYRDWGGEGPVLVLLTGLGDTAAVYDDLAGRLLDEHRIVGITRRGFGESDRSPDGYDHQTRVADDIAVLDGLGIERAVFIGHSIAGDELALLGAEHPDRAVGLIFLDAAVPQRAGRADTPACIQQAELWIPGWSIGDQDPVESGVEHAEAIFGFAVPDAFASEVAASFDFNGGNQAYTGSQGAIGAINEYSAANPVDYAAIGVPALSLAALSDTLETALPWMAEDRIPAPDRAAAQTCVGSVVADQQAAFDEVASTNPAIEAEQWPQTHHYLFLQQPERTAAAIEQWLDQLGW